MSNLLQQIAIYAPVILLALTFHEFCHGYVAWRLGDPTAKDRGRLTMNPLKHLDPLGILAFVIVKIGWAKPVPINPGYFRNPVRDMMLVGLAGPLSNLLLALLSAAAAKLLVAGAAVLPSFLLKPVTVMAVESVWINLVLAIFNLIPIPPLDGSRVLSWFLPPRGAQLLRKMEPFGFLLILLLFYLGIISKILLPLQAFAYRLITG